MIRTPQEFINEVRARFDERLSDEIETHGRAVMHFAEKNNRLRDIVRKTLRAIDALYTVAAPGAIVKELTPDVKCLDVPIGKIVAEARAAIGEDAPSAPCFPAPSVVSSSQNNEKP